MKFNRLIAGLLAAMSLFATACSGGGNEEGTTASVTIFEETKAAESETEAAESETTPAIILPEPDSSLELLTFTPASPSGQVLTEKGRSPQILIRNYNETATDALGRTLITSEEAGLPQENKYVGLFYTVWHKDLELSNMRDVRKSYACNPDSPDLGGAYTWCYWAEPEVGYYRTNDVWKIRRDMYYFAMAGVDFLYLDLTNNEIYTEDLTVLFDTMLAMRAEGQMTPYIVPWINSHAHTSMEGDGIIEFYNTFYTQEKYKDLWFFWEGKPLAMIKIGNDGTLSCLRNKRLTEALTFRVSWVDQKWPATDDTLQDHYNLWLDCHNTNFKTYQFGYHDDPLKAECIGIGAAGWAQAGSGRSGELSQHQYLDRFLETTTMGEGLVLEANFNELMERNPECEVLLLSRWNEWTAMHLGKHEWGYGYSEFGFIDQFNAEFSRDLEPMKGGFTDNYFYQMCNIIRRFKGVLPADENTGAQTMDMTGNFSEWQKITPVFTDFTGDVSERNSTSVTSQELYINQTGRNDIVESRLTANGGMVYVYARTAETITSSVDSDNWMLLFLDADQNKQTGWEGYDYLINYHVIDQTFTTICAFKDGIWQEIGVVSYRVQDNELVVAIPRSLMGLTGESFTLRFHWLDNVTNVYDLECWFTTGDSAPERRNNYELTLNIPYDAAQETLLDARNEEAMTYMPACKLSSDEEAALTEGLSVVMYTLPRNYGKMPDFDLIMKNQRDSAIVPTVTALPFTRNMNYALEFDGYVKVDATNVYSYSIRSNCSVCLYIDGSLVGTIPYDAGRTRADIVTLDLSLRLEEGYHTIRIEYAETGNGSPVLEMDGSLPLYH